MVEYTQMDRIQKYNRYWNMRARCYNENQREYYKGYKGCTVCNEWLEDSQSFYQWSDENYYVVSGERMEIDKDILVPGNTVYSPETCIFVPKRINSLFSNCIETKKRMLPLGVSYISEQGKYFASGQHDGKTVRLGIFDTPEEAFAAYKEFKEGEIKRIADM